MAVYIEIDKISEDDCLAVFLYRIDSGGEGKIQLDKKLGEIILLEIAPGDQGSLFRRASYKIAKHWNEGQLPEFTSWAS